MEKLPDPFPTYYASSIADIKESQVALIQDRQQDVVQQTRSVRPLSFMVRTCTGMNRIINRCLLKQDVFSDVMGVVALVEVPSVRHFRENDEGLPSRQLIIHDQTDQLKVVLQGTQERVVFGGNADTRHRDNSWSGNVRLYSTFLPWFRGNIWIVHKLINVDQPVADNQSRVFGDGLQRLVPGFQI